MKRATHRVSAASLCIVSGLGLAGLPAAGQTQVYPAKSIRFIVPYTAGGASDAVTRVLGDAMRQNLSVPVVVENRGGAGGSIGTEAAARSAPDGYTLMMATIGTHGMNPSLFSKLPYDPVADFEPVCLAASTMSVLVVHPSVPVNSVQELIAHARANPGTLHYGSSGNGTSHHLAGAMFNSYVRINTTHVPYKGTAEMFTDLLGGRIQMTFDPIVSILPHIKSGKVKALAVTSPDRSKSLPDLPTMVESGVANYDVRSWYGVLAPAKTPRDVVMKLNAAVNRVIRMPEVLGKLEQLGAPPIGGTPEDLAAHIQRELKKWAEVIKESGVQIN
jgi:tripartite-type tricarboxylate transporter receptor subunit TctC